MSAHSRGLLSARSKRALLRAREVLLASGLFVCVLIAGSLLASGCVFFRRASTPMESLPLRVLGPQRARGVIVLLPGFGDRPSAFQEHGFVEVLARTAPEYDVVAADAHFNYYRTRALLPRLSHDVIAPLRARGYRELWIAGASLGGFGAVAYARTHQGDVTGLLLFAPYMGPSEVVQKVRSRGLCQYDEVVNQIDSEESFARANFSWLKRHACVEARGFARERRDEHDVALFVGVGDQDRLLAANRLLGDHLAATHMVVLPGGHGWKVWTPALEKLSKVAFDSSLTPH